MIFNILLNLTITIHNKNLSKKNFSCLMKKKTIIKMIMFLNIKQIYIKLL